MYIIKLKNGEIIEATNRKIEETENKASILTFTLLINSPFFNSLKEFIDIVEVYRDGLKVFEGRVINSIPRMSENGIFEYDVTCESELNYLNDSLVGKWDIHPDIYVPEVTTETILDPYELYTEITVTSFMQLLLNNHNSKVSNDKKIFIGNVTVDDTVSCTTDRESTLSIIQDKLVGTKGGYLRLRKVGGINYLDYLAEPPTISENAIELAINMKNISRKGTWESIYTRLTPVGKDGLKISGINNGLDYVQDDEMVGKYGVIETVEKFDNVVFMTDLKEKAISKLAELNQKIYSVECGAIDLNGINGIGTQYKQFELSQYCRLKNSILNFDEIHRIVAITRDLDEEWNVNLTFSNESPSSIRKEIKKEKEMSEMNNFITFLIEALFYKPSESKVTEMVKIESGTTINRPTTNLYIGRIYFDTTLGKQINVKSISPIVWVDGNGSIV